MGSVCIRMSTKKVTVIQKTAETKTITSEELKIFYDINKSTIHKKLHPFYEEVIKTGQCKSETVNLNFIKIQKSGYAYFCNLFPYFKNIKVLKLWKTFLGSEGIKAIYPALANFKNLEVLSLEDNSIGPDGCMYLSIALKRMENLKELWLHINDIGPSGAACLAKEIKHLSKLEKLNLDENMMENKSTLKLVNAIKGFKHLKLLGLGYNKLTEDAVLNIAVMLGLLPLEKLTLAGNELGEGCHSRIMTLLPRTLVIF